ncbi:unnamed protein product [Discosporangium mesarthrocarpum]
MEGRVGMQRHTRRVKLTLTNKQRVDPVGYVLSHLHRRGRSGVSVNGMLDWVHVDERWFYLMKDGKKVYLQPDEEVSKPPRASNKWFILKVMFLAAVALALGSSPMRYGLTGRSVCGQLNTWSWHSIQAKAVAGETLS